MKKYLFVIIFVITIISGCMESLVDETIYETVPVSLRYRISYGYYINSSGNGIFEVNYTCFIPSPLDGYVYNLSVIGNYDYKDFMIENNRAIVWSFNESGEKNIKIGIIVYVRVNSYLVDLDSRGSLDINNISESLKEKFCKDQSLNNKILIQPHDETIKNLVKNLKTSNNSFEIAMSLFKWLKENIRYVYHPEQTLPQSATETLNAGSGDCDELSILYISLCRSANIPSRLVRGYLIEEINKGECIAIPHAWAEIYVGIGEKGWIPVECAGISNNINLELHQNFGVEDVYHLRLYVDNGTNRSLSLSNTGISVRYEKGMNISVEPFVSIDEFFVLRYGKLVVRKDGKRYYY